MACMGVRSLRRCGASESGEGGVGCGLMREIEMFLYGRCSLS